MVLACCESKEDALPAYLRSKPELQHEPIRQTVCFRLRPPHQGAHGKLLPGSVCAMVAC